MLKSKKGFTLIELLLVIAVIAILVAIVIPVMKSSQIKTKAAVDAANLRSVLSIVNIKLTESDRMEDIAKGLETPESKIVPGAKLYINYVKPVGLYTYFVKDGKYYGADYLSELALNGSSDYPLEKPLSVGFWYEAGVGKIE